jgi:hypothetical protein
MIFKPYSYLNQTGWISSHQHVAPIGPENNPAPWLNYSFVEFITKRLPEDSTMFEYGAGFSTLYFSKHMKNITSVEHDSGWVIEVTNRLKAINNKTL